MAKNSLVLDSMLISVSSTFQAQISAFFIPYTKNRYSRKGVFPPSTNSIPDYKQWLFDNSCRNICIKSTGKYWIPSINPFGE